jgi:hypothetical protein
MCKTAQETERVPARARNSLRTSAPACRHQRQQQQTQTWGCEAHSADKQALLELLWYLAGRDVRVKCNRVCSALLIVRQLQCVTTDSKVIR